MAMLTVKATDDEYAGWKARASERGLDLSKWVRMILNGVAGGSREMAPSGRPALAGPVRGGTGPAEHSTDSAPTRDGAEAAEEVRAGAARSSGPRSRYTPPTSPPTAATSGTGVSTPLGTPRSDDGPAPAGAPAPTTFDDLTRTTEEAFAKASFQANLCPHPRDQRQQRAWGAFCLACGRVVR